MDDSIETVELEGNRTLKIFQDDTPIDPRENDNFGTIVCYHRNYTLGDRHEFVSESTPLGDSYADDPDGLKAYVKDHAAVSLPLYLLDHSGLRMNTGGYNHLGYIGYFDSGQVGIIYVTKEKLLKELGGRYLVKSLIKKAREILEGEIREYDAYLAGACYGYQVECNVCHEILDSTWGYLGWDAIDLIKSEVQAGKVECKDCHETANRLELVTAGA